MKQYFFILLCLIFFAASGNAQKKVQFSVEAGASFSQFPIFYRGKYSVTRGLPLPSPVLGLASHLKLTKRLSLSAGLQYQQRGSIIRETAELPNAIGGPFSSNSYERSRFHELAIPATLTVHFNRKKRNFNAIIGFSHLWNLGGYYTLSVKNETNNVQTSKFELSGNPFDASKFKTRGLRAFYQTTLGLSFPLKSKFEISSLLHFSTNNYSITEKPIGQIPGLDYHNYYHYVNGSDFQVVCRYYLN